MYVKAKDLVGKVYGDYNAMAINMGCDCDPTTKKVVLQDLLNQNIQEEEEKKMKELEKISKEENRAIFVHINKKSDL